MAHAPLLQLWRRGGNRLFRLLEIDFRLLTVLTVRVTALPP